VTDQSSHPYKTTGKAAANRLNTNDFLT